MSVEETGMREPSMDLAALGEIVERFSGKKVVLFGDFVADEFQFGEISRVSREAPVLILRHRATSLTPGGGANAAANLVALGAQVYPVTVVGEDEAGASLTQYFHGKGVDTSGILRAENWPTPTKTRFLAGWAHTVAQQVLRVDREPAGPPPEKLLRRLAEKAGARLRSADAMAISDYGFGVASPFAVKQAIRGKSSSRPSTLDARYQLTAYANCGITAATPNEAELEASQHCNIGTDMKELERCGKATLSKMGLQSLLVTRGKDGMALFQRGKKLNNITVHGSHLAVDVTGAGDTVLAAFTLALACGACPLEAAQIANIAGGLVVMKRGTAVITREELRAAIRAEVSGTPS